MQAIGHVLNFIIYVPITPSFSHLDLSRFKCTCQHTALQKCYSHVGKVAMKKGVNAVDRNGSYADPNMD